jgi:hypothetical protein
MRFIVLAALGTCLLGCFQDLPRAGPVAQKKQLQSTLVEKPISAVRAAFLGDTKPAQLEKMAIAVCQAGNDDQIAVLMAILSEPGLVAKLDVVDEDSKLPGGGRLADGVRLQRILRTLAREHPKKAEAAFLKLAETKSFMSDHDRVDVLMFACGEFRRPSQRILDFLEAQVATGSWRANFITRILAEIGSDESLKVIENRFFASDGGRDSGWFRTDLIAIRDRIETVHLYGRILKTGVTDARLRNIIVQTLFDFQPAKWYLIDQHVPKIPNRREAKDEVLDELLAVANLTQKLELTDETRQSVAKGRKEIEEIIAFRKTGKEIVANNIAKLGDSSFQVRNEATIELRKFGDWAVPQLRLALENPPSAEARARIQELINEFSKSKIN